MTQQNSYFIDVEVTHLTPEERQKVKSEYVGRQCFINFSTGWEKGKMFYTFWYTTEKQEGLMKHVVTDDKTLEVLHELFVMEFDEIVKVKRFDIQGSGHNGKILTKE